MSFIDDSMNNVKHQLIREVSAGAVGGFVGRHGKEINQLFAGPYHPDSGHGSENEQLLAKQISDRKKMRADMENEAEKQGIELVGNPAPIGGYYDVDTKEARDTYDILFKDAEEKVKFNQDVTPLADLEWKSTGWDYKYDEIISYIEEKDFINTSETNMEQVDTDIKYDENELYIEEEDFINTSETNMDYVNLDLKYDDFDETMGRDMRNKMFQKIEKIIDEEEIQIDNKGFIEKSKTNIDNIIDEETFTKDNGISLKTIYKNDISLSIHIGS